jgi:cystathionine beta-lyase/cystathionine gamma-synthase
MPAVLEKSNDLSSTNVMMDNYKLPGVTSGALHPPAPARALKWRAGMSLTAGLIRLLAGIGDAEGLIGDLEKQLGRFA